MRLHRARRMVARQGAICPENAWRMWTCQMMSPSYHPRRKNTVRAVWLCSYDPQTPMAQIFHPAMNTVSKVTIFGGIFIIAALAWVSAGFLRSPYYTQALTPRAQPVPFSHE